MWFNVSSRTDQIISIRTNEFISDNIHPVLYLKTGQNLKTSAVFNLFLKFGCLANRQLPIVGRNSEIDH